MNRPQTLPYITPSKKNIRPSETMQTKKSTVITCLIGSDHVVYTYRGATEEAHGNALSTHHLLGAEERSLREELISFIASVNHKKDIGN